MSVKWYSCRECTFASEPFLRNSGDHEHLVIECRLSPPDGEIGFPVCTASAWCGSFELDLACLPGEKEP